MEELDILVLGAGWTATFLLPLLKQRGLAFAATTTNGREVAGFPTIPFKFDASGSSDDGKAAIAALPRARHVLITFPLTGKGPSKFLTETYAATHTRTKPDDGSTFAENKKSHFRFIQLGSTGVWQSKGQQAQQTNTARHSHYPTTQDSPPVPKSLWYTRHSPHDTTSPRAVAEDELLSLGGCVLALSGLWGGARDPRNWVNRVGPTKEAVKNKASLHMIHGDDVARAICAVMTTEKWDEVAEGQRWMITDGFVYDWWALFAGWAGEGKREGEKEGTEAEPTQQAKWVYELMNEEDVRALPRSMEQLGRCYDSREFWATFELAPLRARV